MIISFGDCEWDEQKNAENILNHDGVTLYEGCTVFDDPLFISFNDPDHSITEKRYIAIGHSERNRLLFVSHTLRHSKTRIISARKVTRRERKDYEKTVKDAGY